MILWQQRWLKWKCPVKRLYIFLSALLRFVDHIRIVNCTTFVLLSLHFCLRLSELTCAPLHSAQLDSSRNETVLVNQLIILMHLWLGRADFSRFDITSTPAYQSRHIAARSHSFGKRAFSTAAPSTWNSLPESVLDTDSVAVFKSKLKTHLFTVAYSWL